MLAVARPGSGMRVACELWFGNGRNSCEANGCASIQDNGASAWSSGRSRAAAYGTGRSCAPCAACRATNSCRRTHRVRLRRHAAADRCQSNDLATVHRRLDGRCARARARRPGARDRHGLWIRGRDPRRDRRRRLHDRASCDALHVSSRAARRARVWQRSRALRRRHQGLARRGAVRRDRGHGRRADRAQGVAGAACHRGAGS